VGLPAHLTSRKGESLKTLPQSEQSLEVIVTDELKTVEEIALLPGFTLVEQALGYTVLKVPSGYTLKVKRLGPGLSGLMSDGELADPGPFKITVRLLEKLRPPGIEQEVVYEPPVDENGNPKEPDREEHEQAWVYFQQWKAHESLRREREMKLGLKHFDLAIVNCISVVDGPEKVEEDEWLTPLVDVGADTPKTKGQRLLAFLKSQVITTTIIRDVLVFLMRTEEVELEGLLKAFDTFQRNMAWRKDFRSLQEAASR
jgi:hypothetical protein